MLCIPLLLAVKKWFSTTSRQNVMIVYQNREAKFFDDTVRFVSIKREMPSACGGKGLCLLDSFTFTTRLAP